MTKPAMRKFTLLTLACLIKWLTPDETNRVQQLFQLSATTGPRGSQIPF